MTALERLRTARLARSVGIIAIGVPAFTAAGLAMLPSFHLYTMNLCLLAAIGAVALNTLMGTSGQVSIGSAAFLALGGYGAAYAGRAGLDFPFDLSVGVLLAGVCGALVGLSAMRLQGLYLALATLAGHFIVLYLVGEYQTRTVGEAGFSIPGLFTGQDLDGQQRSWAWTLTGVLVVVMALTVLLLRGRTGRALRLIRTHETVAATVGIPVARYKVVTFMVTSMVISIAGGLAAHLGGSVSTTNYTLALAVSYIAMVIIGGMDSPWGAFGGAIVVTALPSVMTELLDGRMSAGDAVVRAPQFAQIAYGLCLILFVLFAQRGLVGMIGDVRSRLRRDHS